MEIRAAELTADHLGRTARINPGDPTVIVGLLMGIRHRVRKSAPSETESQLDVEVTGGQPIRLSFDRIGCVELL